LENKSLLKKLNEFDAILKDRGPALLKNVIDSPITFNVGETRYSSLAELQKVVGGEAVRVDIPVGDHPQGMIYLADSELMPELTQYLRQEGEGTAQVPGSMQLVLDTAEQLSELEKQIIKEKFDKDAAFGNPSILLWHGESEPVFENGFITVFSGSIGEQKPFSVVRIIQLELAENLMGETDTQEKMTVHKGQFEQFPYNAGIGNGGHPIEFLNDLGLELSVELGRTSMPLKDILKLGAGSIVELDKFASEPVDLYVNQKKFAEGEVVIIDQNFAIRITNLISAQEKLSAVSN